MADELADIPEFTIQPPRGWALIDWNELWHFRELLYFLTWRDIKVRYKQTVIGAAWAVLQPIVMMVVFSVVFAGLMGVRTENAIPYPVFAYAALLPWTFFATALTRSSGSLVADRDLISKVYFPRVIVPTAAVVACAVDFFIASAVLLGLMLFYGILPGVEFLALPPLVLLTFLTAWGIGLWFSALNVKYRDIGYVIPFLVQFWLFITPVAYPTSIVPERWQLIYSLNPMVGVVEGFRWALLGQDTAPGWSTVISAAVIVVTVVGGLIYFRRVESEFADVV